MSKLNKKLLKSIAKELGKYALLSKAGLSSVAGGGILNEQKHLLGCSLNLGGSHNNLGQPFNPVGEIIRQNLPNHRGYGTVTVREPNGQVKRYNVYRHIDGQLFSLNVTEANRFPSQ